MPSPRSTPQNLPAYPGIPDPTADIGSLLETVKRLKEAVEMLTGQRGQGDRVEYSVQGMLREIQQGNSRVLELTEIGDGLASRMDLVETQTNDVSAEGQVVIRAETNPSGYKAYFGVYLKAAVDSTPGSERRAGMHLGLTNADGGVFTLDVDKFQIRDNSSGTATSIFTYGSGIFTLTGNVQIFGGLLVDGSITGGKVAGLTITGAKLVDATIINSKIDDLTLQTGKISYNAAQQLFTNGPSGGASLAKNVWQTVMTCTIVGVAGAYAQISHRVAITWTSGVTGEASEFQIRIIRPGKQVWLDQFAGGGINGVYAINKEVVYDDEAEGNYTYELQVWNKPQAGFAAASAAYTGAYLAIETKKR